jgi:hypothetical protein
MRFRATVVSRSTEAQASLDTGSQVLTHAQYYAKGYGRIVEYPDAQIIGFSEGRTSCLEHCITSGWLCCPRLP